MENQNSKKLLTSKLIEGSRWGNFKILARKCDFTGLQILQALPSQLTFTYSKSTIETLEKV